MVAEVVCNPFDNLPRFVSFAGNDEYITGFEFGDCLLDSLGTVADVDTFGTGRQNSQCSSEAVSFPNLLPPQRLQAAADDPLFLLF